MTRPTAWSASFLRMHTLGSGVSSYIFHSCPIYPKLTRAVFVAIGLVTLRYHRNFLEWQPVVVGWKTLYVLVGFYITSNIFIITLIWWPSVSTIPSYIAPTVATGVLAFGVIYWVGFAKVLPALGYEIDSEPDELIDGSRVVTYKVRNTRDCGIGDALMLTCLHSGSKLALQKGYPAGGTSSSRRAAISDTFNYTFYEFFIGGVWGPGRYLIL